MKDLESFKGVWKNQNESNIKFTKSDIYKMIHQKSSSILKWILIISIIEFVIPNLILLFSDSSASNETYQKYNLQHIIQYYTFIHIAIILVFIFIFYKNYTELRADQSVKKLLQGILTTRKTVKYYIYYNLLIAAVIGIHVFYKVFHSPLFVDKLPQNTSMTLVWTIAIILLAVTVFLFWLFYRILYGYFLKRLNQNYDELKSHV